MGVITNINTDNLALVYFTNTPFTQIYDYSSLYEASEKVHYKNIFPYRAITACNDPCIKNNHN